MSFFMMTEFSAVRSVSLILWTSGENCDLLSSVHPTGTGYHADILPYMLIPPFITSGRQWICPVRSSLNQTHIPFLNRN